MNRARWTVLYQIAFTVAGVAAAMVLFILLAVGFYSLRHGEPPPARGMDKLFAWSLFIAFGAFLAGQYLRRRERNRGGDA
jgi:hypothetical protein